VGAIFLEDLEVGREVVTARRTVTEADVAAFAGLSWDVNPLHTDEVFVREHTPFRGRIAHGLLVLSMTSGLRSELDDVRSIAFLEVQRRFVAPAYPGDTIHATWRVEETRRSRSRPDAGVVRLSVEVVNQDGEVVQSGTDVWLVAAREHEDGDARPDAE
jgi:3-hydroxybutyryl-CoA dehydratase